MQGKKIREKLKIDRLEDSRATSICEILVTTFIEETNTAIQPVDRLMT